MEKYLKCDENAQAHAHHSSDEAKGAKKNYNEYRYILPFYLLLQYPMYDASLK